MIDILIVANSAVDRGLLQGALGKNKKFRIVQTLNNDLNELRVMELSEPDIILFFQQSRQKCNMDGVRFLRKKFQAPIIVCTEDQNKLSQIENTVVFPKIELRLGHPEFEFWFNELTTLIEKVANHKTPGQLLNSLALKSDKTDSDSEKKQIKRVEIIAIGASTGGPQTLDKFLSLIPKNLNVPLVIVQHMPANFLSVLIGWLQNDCPLPIKVAKNGEKPQPGVVYFAPDNYHLTINREKVFELVDDPPMHNVKPSASFLFKSVAEVYGNKAIGILFTGMGKDGAKELALIKEKGGITFAQDKESSIIFGMPKEAIRLNGATYIMPPEKIAQKMREFF